MINGNVEILDPNLVNTDPNMVNSIPQYQDMHIFVELLARSRGRTVIITGNDGTVSKGTFKTGLEKPRDVNLLGVNQINEDDNPNYLKFTTNYYDGSTGNYVQYESFGISNIKIVVNSSFVPQVNIQFVDIRGLSFFNQEGSPYRMLFDFPPPIFELSVKGYYGKTLSYQLHLVKYTSEFQSDSGNFVIDAQFVAVTFAPLADILFRYIVNTPLIGNLQSMNSLSSVEPQNTFELILKLKNLYSPLVEKLKSDEDAIRYDNINKQLKSIEDAMSMLRNFREDQTLSELGNTYLIVRDVVPGTYVLAEKPSDEDADLVQLDGLWQYDEKIKSMSVDGKVTRMDSRLYVLTPVQSNLTPLAPVIDDVGETPSPFSFNRVVTNKSRFDTYKYKLITRTRELLGGAESEFRKQISDIEFNNYYNITNNKEQNTTTKYIGIDVTDYYLNLYNKKSELIAERISISGVITDKINEMVIDRLGMSPTIYNIFRIILNDVDTFFRQLHTVSKRAEESHNSVANKNIILGDSYKDFKDKIYAFPLIVDTQKVVCGGNKEERIAPIELSKKVEFPEITFVDDFITTFFTQQKILEQSYMREKKLADGTNEWLPISPFDSTIGTDDARSPYFDIDSIINAPNLSQDNRLTQVLKIMINRHYILSQYVIPDNYYNLDKRSDSDKSYIQLYAESEAVNLASSITNTTYGNNIKSLAKQYKNNVNGFYELLQSTIPGFYGFDNEVVISLDVTPTEKAYINKNIGDFIGLNIYDGDIVEQQINSESSRPIDLFKSNVARGFWGRIFKGNEKEVFYQFTQENVQFIPDKRKNRDGEDKTDNRFDNDGNNIITRFLTAQSFYIDESTGSQYSLPSGRYPETTQLLANGNLQLERDLGKGGRVDLNKFKSIIDIWSTELARTDTIIYNDIIKTPSKLSALYILSNLGHAVSPFNKFPNRLNKLIFTTPAVIEVPAFLPLYLGALIDAKESEWEDDFIGFLTSGSKASRLQNNKCLILADYHDVNKYLSKKDKELLKNRFLNFYFNGSSSGEYGQLLLRIQELYESVKNNANKNKLKVYEELLDTTGAYYGGVMKPLLRRTNIVVFGQFTFKMSDTYPTAYKSLKNINEENSEKKAINDGYFQIFLEKLFTSINDKDEEIRKDEEEEEKKKSDKDIVTQTYYSFKNINDKWLTSPTKNTINGYPFGRDGKPLIDSFVFVDRAMNPIGDTILNAEILIDLFDDPNASVFSVLSQLLSLNGFEFFPLQNFMSYTNESWEDTFKINVGGEASKNIAFVCMYIGGTSSYPSTGSNDFVNDGIVDLGNTDAKDFNTSEENCNPNPSDDNQEANNPDFPWRRVRAFRVRFGEQNQSMFMNMKIDSKEYPETNESIQILSRLAGDTQGTTPIPKGQNLYNLYENRAYKATISGLGNAMIQPTQYFQLENIPIFNGAYLILSVEHEIANNRMTTSFSGTKIMRYPVPRVMSPIAFIGFEGGESDFTSIRNMSGGQLTAAANIIDSEQKVRFNSMYEFKVR